MPRGLRSTHHGGGHERVEPFTRWTRRRDVADSGQPYVAKMDGEEMRAMGFRITLGDRPGELAAIAAAIAEAGANILTIDVQELDGENVIDEMILEVPADLAPGALRAQLLSAGATSVVSMSVDYRSMDAQVRCLNAVAALARPDVSPVQALSQALSMLVSAQLRVVRPEDSQLAWLARERDVPVVEVVHDGEGVPRVVLAIAYPVVSPDAILLLERPGRVRFSATEVARVRAMLHVHQLFDGLSGGPLRSEVRSLLAHPARS